tara:strand:- start:4517 stop:5476 length:960 start_codon:yes stop_codon:yes gene_type:complete
MLIDKKQKIFVTGHKGMVGSALVRTFRKNGYQNIMTIDKANLDLRIKDDVDIWFKENQPDIVILAAGKVGGIKANNTYPVDFLLDNLNIQNNVIYSSYKYCQGRFLFLGSSCIYPKFAENPISEESLLSGSLESTNESYAIAKIAGLKLCSALKRQYGFDAISAMPANLYGPGDNYHKENSHVLPALIRKFQDAVDSKVSEVECWGSGLAKREFLHVDDLARACVYLLEKWIPEVNEIQYLNIGSSEEISIKNLAELIAKIIGYEGEITWNKDMPDGTPRRILDLQKINKLGWSNKINLEEGIKDTIRQYQQVRHCLRT